MLKFLHIYLIAFLAFVFNACASNEIIFKEVKVPIKCDIPKRERPPKDKNINKYFNNILVYTELLENDLAFCRGEEIKK